MLGCVFFAVLVCSSSSSGSDGGGELQCVDQMATNIPVSEQGKYR